MIFNTEDARGPRSAAEISKRGETPARRCSTIEGDRLNGRKPPSFLYRIQDSTYITRPRFCPSYTMRRLFLRHFNDLADPRQPGKVTYSLSEILALCLLAVVAGAECFTEIAVSNAWLITCSQRAREAQGRCHGRTTSWQASSQREMFTRFPGWAGGEAGIFRKRSVTRY
jgi:hypothetical protein